MTLNLKNRTLSNSHALPAFDLSTPLSMTSEFPYTKKAWIGVSLSACALVLLVCFDPQLQSKISQLEEIDMLKVLMSCWKRLGEEWAISAFILSGIFLEYKRRQSYFLWFVSSMLGVAVLVQATKHLLGRVRPASAEFQNIFFGPLAYFRVPPEIKIDSMPSGHTAAAFAMAMCLGVAWPRLTWLWFFMALGVGFSRIVSNAHFSSDVFLGAGVGLFVSLFTKSRFDRLGLLGNPAGVVRESLHREDGSC